MAPPVGSCQQLAAVMSRRKKIVYLVSRGWPQLDIAREIGVSTRTVQRHIAGHWAGVLPKNPGPKPR